MRENWGKAFEQVLRSEGGYSNDNADHGGETNLGVTRAAWGEYLRRPVHSGEMRALTRDMVKPFYKSRYWDAVRGDELPAGLDYAVFDFAVNAGPRRAAKFLQRAVGVADNGMVGPATMAAVARTAPAVALERFGDAKAEFYRGLVARDPSQAKFIKGWMNRVAEVQRTAATMVA